MLKQTVTYENYDGEMAEETLYFNLSKVELAENSDLTAEFEDLKTALEGPNREISPAEVKQILALVKKLMRLAYGVRSEDGKRFIKTADVWVEFTQTAAYDAFLFSLFETSDKAIAFLLGIMPKDLRTQAEAAYKENEMQNVELPKVDQDAATHIPEEHVRNTEVDLAASVEPEDPKLPAYILENREPTQKELSAMTRAELVVAMQRKNQG